MITGGIIIIFWTSADAIYIHINVQHSCPAAPGHALVSFPPPGAVGLSVLHSRPLRFVRRCAKLQHLLHRLCPPPLRGRRWCLLAFFFFIIFRASWKSLQKKIKNYNPPRGADKKDKNPGVSAHGGWESSRIRPSHSSFLSSGGGQR